MTDKEIFITEVESKIDEINFSEQALNYFNYLKQDDGKEHIVLTEKGQQILQFMSDFKNQYNNIFKSKDIADGLDVPPRQVSGSMQKLIKEGFCEKLGGSPVCYKITEIGEKQING